MRVHFKMWSEGDPQNAKMSLPKVTAIVEMSSKVQGNSLYVAMFQIFQNIHFEWPLSPKFHFFTNSSLYTTFHLVEFEEHISLSPSSGRLRWFETLRWFEISGDNQKNE